MANNALEYNKAYDKEAVFAMNNLLEPNSVDLIVADLPYGVTANKYDKVIPYEDMWDAIHRIAKPNAAIVLFGQSKFYIQMCASNIDEFRHDYCWNKKMTSGFLNAQYQPLRQHENIAVFYRETPTYNPQFSIGPKLHSQGNAKTERLSNNNYDKFNAINNNRAGLSEKYPTSILNFPVKDKDISFYADGIERENQIFEINDFLTFQKIHPSKAIHQTEKPQNLLDFLIKTYSNQGDLVLDFCCGSGSTLLSAIKNKRNAIGFDFGVCLNPKSQYYNMKWADITNMRIQEYYDSPEQMSLFAI